MRLGVTGGYGAVGRHFTRLASELGHTPVVLSRRSGVDLMVRDGLTEHLIGLDAVVDLASPSTLSTRKIVSYFTTATHHLLSAEREAGVPHHVALSIIGATAAPSGYYAGKARQEALIEASTAAWSMLRTTQFHEFAEQTVQRGTIAGCLFSPQMRTQPVAAAAVAAELLEIVMAGPQGLLPDLAGPQEESMPDMVRRFARARGMRNPLLAIPMPGAAGRAMRNGGLLPPPGTRCTDETFEEWLRAFPEPTGT